jgi:hypothetical protein
MERRVNTESTDNKRQTAVELRSLEMGKGPMKRGKWQGVTIYHDVIESPVVDTWTQGLVLLLHKEEPCTGRGGRTVNAPGSQRVLIVFLHGLGLRTRQGK